jgi:hypothetical protein
MAMWHPAFYTAILRKIGEWTANPAAKIQERA